MGAWGLGLFQSDHDLDLVSDLTGEAGLYKLADEVNKAARKAKPKDDDDKAKKPERDFGINYSIYLNDCSDDAAVEFSRKHLDSGALGKLIDRYTAKMKEPEDKWSLIPPDYTLVIVGACAMSLGCTLPDTFTAWLKANYTKTRLMRDAITQMKKALFGPNGAQAGTPYDFASRGLMETMAAGGPPDEDTMYPESKYGKKQGGFKLMNVQSPFGLPPLPPDAMADLRAKFRASDVECKFADGVCNGCGAKEKKGGGALLACAKCKQKKYCGKECQTKMWKVHKVVCEPAAPAAGGKEN